MQIAKLSGLLAQSLIAEADSYAMPHLFTGPQRRPQYLPSLLMLTHPNDTARQVQQPGWHIAFRVQALEDRVTLFMQRPGFRITPENMKSDPDIAECVRLGRGRRQIDAGPCADCRGPGRAYPDF